MSPLRGDRKRGRVHSFRKSSGSSLTLLALLAASPSAAETAQPPEGTQLPRVVVTSPPPSGRSKAGRPKQAVRPPAGPATPVTTTPATTPLVTTPLNTGAVAGSASRLGLPVLQTPASVEVVSQETMKEQGYRTTTEAAQGAVGVLSGDAAGAPAAFQMRGFTFGEVNVLYNGISTGPQSITSRWMDTAALQQVEFLKGPSALMSGLNAIGGSVNYVSLQPTPGRIRNELDLSIDSLGTFRSHYGSTGTMAKDLDYRFDAIGTRLNGYIDDVNRNLTALSTQFNYRVNNDFKTFVAVEYKKDTGHAYWGTPLIPTSFAGPFAKSGVVSGTANSTFTGDPLGPVTFDTRTRKTNYNVLDNSTWAYDTWLRTGFEWALANNVTLKNQSYYYQAKRSWLDSETYSFCGLSGSSTAPCSNPDKPTGIDRDRFFVGHKQNLIGNNTDLTWDSYLYGMENRLGAQLQVSRNKITFTQHTTGAFGDDGLTVDVINPDRGFYGPIDFAIRNKQLDTVAASVEDRLKLTPQLALIGGVRLEHIRLESNGINANGEVTGSALPFTKIWNAVPYRAAFTYEPIRNLVFYAMTSTAYDPAAAGIFSINPGSSLQLTSARLYEAGVKHLFWDNRAEWTLSAYDITRRNVFVRISTTVTSLAGEVDSKGIEFNAAVRPIDGLKLWGNIALIDAEYKDFFPFTGNTPSNIAPLIINAGASYRFANAWTRWPVEIGGSVRHVGRRFLFEDDLTRMEPYTIGDVFAFVDIPGRDIGNPDLKDVRLAFRVRNITNAVYAAWSDPGYQDQFYLGAPRTFEFATSFKW
jgi:iron complex outermembrane receptor protein